MSEPSLDEVLRALWERLGPEQRDSARQLLDNLERVREHGEREAWERVRTLAHRLAGTLGSLGQERAGREAMAMEELTTGVEYPDAAILERLTAHALDLRRYLEPTAPDAPAG